MVPLLNLKIYVRFLDNISADPLRNRSGRNCWLIGSRGRTRGRLDIHFNVKGNNDMANLIENYLKISAEKEDALKKAMLVIQSEILSPPSPYKVSTRDIFDKENQMHIFEMDFDTHWSPPFRTYMELKSIEGISIDATWRDEGDHYDTRYRWTGEDRYLREYASDEGYQCSIQVEEQEYETALYEEIMQYAKGGLFHIRDIDSLDDVLAFIAKVLIAGNPGLSDWVRKKELLAAANKILESDSILDALICQSIDTVRRVAIRETNRYLDGLSESG
jgi:hypothetical protein